MSDPLVTESFQKARKLVEALLEPHENIGKDGDHEWRKCRRCHALTEMEGESGRLLLMMYRDTLESAAVREQRLRAALVEALDKWENAAIYKGADLITKHGDAERIAKLRALVGDALKSPVYVEIRNMAITLD